MKKTSYIVIALALLTAGFSSCRKGDDLFVSPNAPVSATPQTMLSAVEVGTFNNLEGGTARIASIFVQHNSGVAAQSIVHEQYNPTPSDMDNYWSGVYLTMNNCKLLNNNFGTANPYYAGISKVILAMNLGNATDLWGDVPYTEAFMGQEGNFTPHYDSQESVLTAVQTLLDGAITDLAQPEGSNKALPGSDDFIFNGDVAAWTRTAYTLKARYYSRLSKKSGYSPATLLDYLSHGISSNAENCYSVHGTGGAEYNQWFAFLNDRSYMVASQTLVDAMGNMTDPRTAMYFDVSGTGEAVGNVLGELNTDASYWGPYLTPSPDQHVVLVSYAEAKYMEAEAKVRMGDATAFTTLNDAIKASVDEVTAGADDGSTIAIYTDVTTDLSAVMTEKWKAMFAQPVEAYSDIRRTGYPLLTPNPNAMKTYIPVRLPTSLTERNSNPNAPQLDLNIPVWYAQ